MPLEMVIRTERIANRNVPGIMPGTSGSQFCFSTRYRRVYTGYARFETVSRGSDSMRELFIAEAHQNIHRVNLFADGVWVLLGAIPAAIRLVGLWLVEAKK